MKAACLYEWGKPLKLEEVPVPEVTGDGVLVRVVGSYVCSSDIGLLSSRHRSSILPFIPGHNVTGRIEETGPMVTGFSKGDMVAVYGAWGCGNCRLCRQGDEQLCDMKNWVGFGINGGYAEYLYLPHQRHLINIQTLNPLEVAPLLDAGLTAYRAVKHGLPLLYPGAAIEILGSGNIGYYAVQLAKILGQGATVIAVDVSLERLGLAARLGADCLIEADSKAVENIRKITGQEGVQVIVDTVGNNDTLRIAAETAGKKSAIFLVGLGGGTIPRLPGECSIANSIWGTYNEMKELLVLYKEGKLQCAIKTFPLDRINEVLQLMQTKQLHEQVVITP